MTAREKNKSSYPEIGKRQPLLELKGPLAKIDLSAWISGFAYVSGIMIIIAEHHISILQQNPFALIAIAFCLILFFFCITHIQRHMGMSIRAKTYGEPRQLVTSGPFSYTRNPIYVAFLLPLASLALLSLSAAALAVALYVTAMNLTVLRKEERDLSRVFGQTYADYAANVPRWFL